MALLLVRHAHAVPRGSVLSDADRPLSEKGRIQAEGLVSLAGGRAEFRPRRILSGPSHRCMATVAPLSEAVGVPVEAVDALAEGCGEAAWGLVQRLVHDGAVLCTHASVLDQLLDRLISEPTTAERAALRLRKAEAWLVVAAGDRLTIADHLERSRAGTLQRS